jgi:hypothetical protein
LERITHRDQIDPDKKLYYTINGGFYKGMLHEYHDPASLIDYLIRNNKNLDDHGWYQEKESLKKTNTT